METHAWNTELRAQLVTACRLAADHETTTGCPHYVFWSVPDARWEITAKMPMLVEWYTPDGIRHG